MAADIDAVAYVVSLNGGSLIGKTRLQKTFYFLETADVGFGFEFEYYHYGPFSEELALSSNLAVVGGSISADSRPGAHGVNYVTYLSELKIGTLGQLDHRRIKILEVLKRYDSIVLELAATGDFLSRSGVYPDPWSETIIRKAAKASPDRIEKAKSLLAELHS